MAERPRYSLPVMIAITLGACSYDQLPPPSRQVMYPLNPATVTRVQVALRNRGYYAGAVDGYIGARTARAIELFQVDHCQRVKPVIDRSLLISLGLERSDSVVSGK